MLPDYIDAQDLIFLITTPLSLLGELSILVTFLRYPRQLILGGAVYISFIFFQVLSTFLLSAKMCATTCVQKALKLLSNVSSVFLVLVDMQPGWNNTDLDEEICFALGILDQFSYASTVCWDFMIMIQILYLLYKVGGASVGGFDFEENKFYWNVAGHGTVWILAATSAIVPGALKMYGASLNGCYITDEHLKTILAVSLVPMSFFMLTAFIVLFIALWNRKEFARKRQYVKQVGTKEEIQQFPNFWLLVGFTSIFIFHWMPYVCLRLLEQISISYRSTLTWSVLSYAQAICFTTQGISSAIVWWLSGISPTIMNTEADSASTWPELAELIDHRGHPSLGADDFPDITEVRPMDVHQFDHFTFRQLSNFNIFLLDNQRSRAFTQLLLQSHLFPANIYLLVSVTQEIPTIPPTYELTKQEFFDSTEAVWVTLQKFGLKYTIVRNTDLNADEVVEVAKKAPAEYSIYCGGPVLQKNILETSKWIHCHPGRTPDFKGSTCFYYSLLAEKDMWVTSFFMEEALDEGAVILQKRFEAVKGVNIDSVFDPWMRAVVLVETLKAYTTDGNTFKNVKPLPEGAGETYFVIHPVLKSLAIRIAQTHGRESKNSHCWIPPEVSKYEYVTQNRIEHPHKYSFSPFGDVFMQHYHQSRSETISLLEQKGNIDKGLMELLGEPFPTKTAETLRNLILLVQQDGNLTTVQITTSPWVKKYENFKRLYTTYDQNFRKASEDCRQVNSYLLLGILCFILFSKTNNFKFCSAGIKLCDTVCSVMDIFEFRKNDFCLGLYLLKQEQKIVIELEGIVKRTDS